MEITVYDVADELAARAADPGEATVARVIDLVGFSSRFTCDLAILSDDGITGEVLGGLGYDRILFAAGAATLSIVEVGVKDDDAIRAGLSCGGQARVLIQPLAGLPTGLWTRFVDREPALLITELEDPRFGETELVDDLVAADRRFPGLRRLYGRGETTSVVMHDDEDPALISIYWPTRRLVVIGDGLIADALVTFAARLGWVTARSDDDTELDELGRSDAMVVLSHDRRVDVPALAAGLAGRCGYIGALGSRRTQAERRDALAARGIEDLTRVHGPAGLDIGAISPAEIAVSIIAEILATRAGTDAGSLSARSGPVNAGPVNAGPVNAGPINAGRSHVVEAE